MTWDGLPSRWRGYNPEATTAPDYGTLSFTSLLIMDVSSVLYDKHSLIITKVYDTYYPPNRLMYSVSELILVIKVQLLCV